MSRNRYMVSIVFLTFFVMSLLTNILGPIVPDIITSFKVTLAAAAFLPFSFFIAYGVMSVPAGFLVERFGEKPVMIAAFLAGTAGSLSFAVHPSYRVAVVSLFVMGSGMATLQTAINPLLRVSGGEEHFAFNSAFAQLIFGIASFISPYIYSYLVLNLGRSTHQSPLLDFLARITPHDLPWASMYWIFAVFTLLMVPVLLFSRFPRVERTADESAGSWEMYGSLFRKPMVWAFFGCVFAYVGSEQGTADWISKFLSSYHGFDPPAASGCAREVDRGHFREADHRVLLVAQDHDDRALRTRRRGRRGRRGTGRTRYGQNQAGDCRPGYGQPVLLTGFHQCLSRRRGRLYRGRTREGRRTA